MKLMKSALEAIKESHLSEYERQVRLEENALHAAIERWKYDYEQMKKVGKAAAGTPNLKKSMWVWHEELVPKIQAELDACKDPSNKGFLYYYN